MMFLNFFLFVVGGKIGWRGGGDCVVGVEFFERDGILLEV